MSLHLDIQRPTRHVARLWLARPEVRNAFNAELIAELRAAFETLSAKADYSWEQNRADARALLRDVAGQPISAALREDTARRIADTRASDEGREGVQAFLQGRQPAWLPPQE
jgi:enoyl-CoA hydratase/carnithine racemase